MYEYECIGHGHASMIAQVSFISNKYKIQKSAYQRSLEFTMTIITVSVAGWQKTQTRYSDGYNHFKLPVYN